MCTLKNQAQCSAIKSKDHCCTSTSKAQVQMSPASDLFDLTIRVWTLSYKYDYFCRVGQNGIYMVYIRYFWQGNPHTYGHERYVYIWCTYGIFRREIPIHTVIYRMYIYGVHTVFLAGKYTIICDVYIWFWSTLYLWYLQLGDCQIFCRIELVYTYMRLRPILFMNMSSCKAALSSV